MAGTTGDKDINEAERVKLLAQLSDRGRAFYQDQKRGALERQFLVPSQNPDQFTSLLRDFVRECQPVGRREQLMVEYLAYCTCELRQITYERQQERESTAIAHLIEPNRRLMADEAAARQALTGLQPPSDDEEAEHRQELDQARAQLRSTRSGLGILLFLLKSVRTDIESDKLIGDDLRKLSLYFGSEPLSLCNKLSQIVAPVSDISESSSSVITLPSEVKQEALQIIDSFTMDLQREEILADELTQRPVLPETESWHTLSRRERFVRQGFIEASRELDRLQSARRARARRSR